MQISTASRSRLLSRRGAIRWLGLAGTLSGLGTFGWPWTARGASDSEAQASRARGRERADEREGMAFLRGLSRDVVEAARVKPGERRAGSPANSVGFTLIMPGGAYPAYWIRDFAMSLDCGVITVEEMSNHLRLTAQAQNGPSDHRLRHGLTIPPFAIPDHITFEGGAVFYPGTYGTGDDQGTGAYGLRPPIDDYFEFIHIAYRLFRARRETAFLSESIRGMTLLDRLQSAFAAPPVHAPSGLVETDIAQRAVGFGFCDAIVLTGKLLFPSLLRYRAAGELAEMLTAMGRRSAAKALLQVKALVGRNIAPTFQDPARVRGWLLAATEIGRQADVWGTLYAMYLGALRGAAARRATQTVIEAVRQRTITYQAAVRHVPSDLDASKTSAWEQTAGVPVNSYQNGAYWHVPTGWLIRVVGRQDPALARELFAQYVDHLRREDFRRDPAHHAPWECLGPGGYAQNGVYMASVALPYAVLAGW